MYGQYADRHGFDPGGLEELHARSGADDMDAAADSAPVAAVPAPS